MVQNSNPREKFVEWKEDQRSALMHSLNVNTKQTFTRFFAKNNNKTDFRPPFRVFLGGRALLILSLQVLAVPSISAHAK